MKNRAVPDDGPCTCGGSGRPPVLFSLTRHGLFIHRATVPWLIVVLLAALLAAFGDREALSEFVAKVSPHASAVAPRVSR